jgi:deazaflavin-dependent oxidoreductase (nitroreductase family)
MNFWKILKVLNRNSIRLLEQGKGPQRMVLLLTTTGRKSGLPRHTPLQYEEAEGMIYVASARGREADWYRNILANPHVLVHLRGGHFEAVAQAVEHSGKIADFFELRLRRHPLMMRLLLRAEGLPFRFTREELERFAEKKAMVVIVPTRGIMQN